MVNNAGIGREGTVETTSEEVFDELMAVNLKGPFFVAQAAISRLHPGGRIINLSSALSRHPYPRMAAYSMGKAALNHFTLILAAKLGPRGITVNAIGPGLTVTDCRPAHDKTREVVQHVSAHTALGRLGEVEDIAGVAAWLASDDARWVTGRCSKPAGDQGWWIEIQVDSSLGSWPASRLVSPEVVAIDRARIQTQVRLFGLGRPSGHCGRPGRHRLLPGHANCRALCPGRCGRLPCRATSGRGADDRMAGARRTSLPLRGSCSWSRPWAA